MADAHLGKVLPEVVLSSTKRDQIRLPHDLMGQWTLLYFYPQDDTPGCTKQACGYRDDLAQFEQRGVRVIGVSSDDLNSHQAFEQKYSLNFELIFDQNHKLSEALGVYGDQTWNDKTFKGLSRDTFLIDNEGVIKKVWRAVSPETTIAETYQEVLQKLDPDSAKI